MDGEFVVREHQYPEVLDLLDRLNDELFGLIRARLALQGADLLGERQGGNILGLDLKGRERGVELLKALGDEGRGG